MPGNRTPRGRKHRVRVFLRDRIALVMAITLIAGLGIMLLHVARLQSRLIRSAALESAKLYADAVAEFRTVYTSEVVERVRPHGIDVRHDYLDTNGAIPLPATMSMILGERIGNHQSGARTRLYSPYPFPWRRGTGGLRDAFAVDAWSALSDNRDVPYYRFEEVNGRPSLRYATADIMRASCIDCHDTHPQTPKSDWNTGDLRGVLEVVIPLDTIVAQTRQNLAGTIVGVGIAATMAVLGLVLVMGALRRRSVRLETLVEHRTASLQSANAHLQTQLVERRRAERTLVERESRLRAIVDHADEAVMTVNVKGIITSFNPKAEAVFGCDRAQAIGRNIKMFMPEDAAEGHDGHIARYLKTGEAHIIGTGREVVARRRDGTTFPAHLSLSMALVGSEHLFVGLLRDLTEEKALQARLSHAEKMQAIGQLAAGIAHEINTPTQYVGDNTRFVRDSVEGLLKLADRCAGLVASAREGRIQADRIAELESAIEDLDLEFVKEEVPRAIEQTLEGVGRVAEIVLAMKEFSHPGSDEKTTTDLNRAIESTITVCRNRWKYVADLETDFQSGLPMVPCLTGEFNQVILNIVVNAADAIGGAIGDGPEAKGRITVRTREDRGFVEIRVSDTGGGIPEAIRQKVFDPFFTTKEVGKGTGQGLAISHDVIVNKHGGTIDVDSEAGVGTTFIIRLPIAAEPAAENKEAA